MCGLCLSVKAQSVNVEDTVHVMDDVTVTGHQTPSSTISTVPVQTISGEQLLRIGALDAGDALKHFAGVQVKDYGGIGGLKTVSIRGLGAQHTGVSYDGVQVGDCQSGQVDLSRFSVGNMSSVRLTIGQSEDIYQSAKSYASAAVVEISSAMQNDTTRRLHIVLRMTNGSYGLAEPSAIYTQSFGRLSVGAYASYQRADGNYRFKLWNGTSLIDEKRNNSDIEAWRGEVNVGYRIGKHQTLSWKLYGFDSHRGLPGAVIYDNTYSAERLTDKNIFTQLKYENIFSDKIKLKAAAKWNYSWNRDFNVFASGPDEDKYRQNETYLTATLWTEPVSHLHVSLAQDFAHNFLSMTIRNCQYPTRNSWWTALAANYDGLRNVVFNASLLSTNIHESVRVGQASDGFHRLSPAFSVQWHLSRDMRLRASYKDIFRTPTLNDFYYTGIGRRTLRPERTRQWNIGATYGHNYTPNNYLAVTLDGYYGNVSDKIVAVPRMFLWQMMNVGKVHMLGIDATVAGGFAIADGWLADVTATYNYMNATDRTDHKNVEYGDQIAYTPRHSASGTLTLRSPYVDITYNVLLTGRRYMLGYNIPQNRMGGFADHSVSLSRRLVFGRTAVRLQFDVRNISGKNYEVVRFYPMAGTNVRFTAGLEL